MMNAQDHAREDIGDDNRGRSPLRGPLGTWDRLVGPGASAVENVGTVCGVLAGALAARLANREREGLRWTGAQRGVVAVIAADLWGGVWCNATPAARRWYHRPGQGLRAQAAIAAAPRALRRPLALALYAGAVLLNLYRWRPTPGLAWFAPVFFLKLLVAHALGDDAATPRAGDADGAAGR